MLNTELFRHKWTNKIVYRFIRDEL